MVIFQDSRSVTAYMEKSKSKWRNVEMTLWRNDEIGLFLSASSPFVVIVKDFVMVSIQFLLYPSTRIWSLYLTPMNQNQPLSSLLRIFHGFYNTILILSTLIWSLCFTPIKQNQLFDQDCFFASSTSRVSIGKHSGVIIGLSREFGRDQR